GSSAARPTVFHAAVGLAALDPPYWGALRLPVALRNAAKLFLEVVILLRLAEQGCDGVELFLREAGVFQVRTRQHIGIGRRQAPRRAWMRLFIFALFRESGQIRITWIPRIADRHSDGRQAVRAARLRCDLGLTL